MASEDGESGEPTPEESQSPFVGQDSNLVLDDSRNDKIGILSHEGRDATERPDGVKTRENVQNEANLASTQGSSLIAVESSAAENEGRKRSQSAARSLSAYDAGDEPFDPIAQGCKGKDRAGGGASIGLVVSRGSRPLDPPISSP